MYPVLFEFGFITIYALWFFVTLGFLVSCLIFINLAKRNRLKLDMLTDNTLFLFIVSLIGSRLTFILSHLDLYFLSFDFSEFLHLFALWDKGFSFWGAFIGMCAGILYLVKRNKMEIQTVIRLSDFIAPALLIGMSLGSIGALLDGTNYGNPTNLPWGISFRSASVKYITPIHPTQLYSALYTFAIALFLLRLIKKTRGKAINGLIAEIGLVLFSFAKFIEEFFRGDEVIEIFYLRLPQLLAFAVMCFGIYLLTGRYANKNGKDPEGVFKSLLAPVIQKLSRSKKLDFSRTSEAKTVV